MLGLGSQRWQAAGVEGRGQSRPQLNVRKGGSEHTSLASPPSKPQAMAKKEYSLTKPNQNQTQERRVRNSGSGRREAWRACFDTYVEHDERQTEDTVSQDTGRTIHVLRGDVSSGPRPAPWRHVICREATRLRSRGAARRAPLACFLESNGADS